jgi:hypothetical protein
LPGATLSLCAEPSWPKHCIRAVVGGLVDTDYRPSNSGSLAMVTAILRQGVRGVPPLMIDPNQCLRPLRQGAPRRHILLPVFIPPLSLTGNLGQCQKVAGPINPVYWCRLFARGQSKWAKGYRRSNAVGTYLAVRPVCLVKHLSPVFTASGP